MAKYDDRGREAKALEHWKARNLEWEAMARRIAAKVGKEESEVLHKTVHRWREAIEERDYIDAAVPQVIKSGNLSWEMSLRGGSGGLKYVKFGSSYPYPLYCPVRNRDLLSSDHNTFMRVVTETGCRDSKRGSTLGKTKYFKDREKEYKKYISRRFPHKVHNPPRELLTVDGVIPPWTDQVPDEDEDVAPIQHYEFEKEHTPEPASPSLAEKDRTEAASDAVSEAAVPAEEAPSKGPLMHLSTTRLCLYTEPDELGQGSLEVSNMGTTAIYYNWIKLPQPVITDSRDQPLPTSNDGQMFVLSESPSGVLLPGDKHSFVFAFRNSTPCICTEEWCLHTVPSAKVVVSLRGVVLDRECDPVSVNFLNSNLQERMREAMARDIFVNLLNAKPVENVFDISDASAKERRAKEEEELAAKRTIECEEDNHKAFVTMNEDLGVHYLPVVYREFDALFRTLYRSTLEGSSHDATWDGCVPYLLEMIQGLSNPCDQKEFLDIYMYLFQIASFNFKEDVFPPPIADLPQLSLTTLVLYNSFHRCITQGLGEMVDRSTAIQENLGLIESAAPRAPPKGAKAAKAAGKRGGKVVEEEKKSEEELREIYLKRLEVDVTNILLDVVTQALTMQETAQEIIHRRLHSEPSQPPTVEPAEDAGDARFGRGLRPHGVVVGPPNLPCPTHVPNRAYPSANPQAHTHTHTHR